MHRRTFLAAAGTTIAGLSGCLGGFPGGGSTPVETTRATTTGEVISAETTARSDRTTQPESDLTGPRHGDDLPADPDPADGFPPQFETVPPAPSVDPSTFEQITVDGQPVPLAPIEVTYAWYARGEARFADARGEMQYERSHVYGAVSSPVGTGPGGDGPVADWPKGERVVCYCGCPHHLSSMRAAELLRAGYESVFVIDEGFWEWHGREYPMAGSDVAAAPSLAVVEGVVDPAHAGDYALATHRPTDQLEAARIGSDGRYRLDVRFDGIGPSSLIAVTTPAYEVTAPLGELTSGVLRGD